MAKADIAASAIEMVGWPERESGSFSNRFRNKATKESAERCLRVIRELFMTTSVLWSRKNELVTEFGLTKNRYVCPVFWGRNADAGIAGRNPTRPTPNIKPPWCMTVLAVAHFQYESRKPERTKSRKEIEWECARKFNKS
ncbi:MAG: hypothetical protein EXS16_16170 [Gemmataceae bacterium]|nr:hypothetical protein [Gemmataceae bacterium]